MSDKYVYPSEEIKQRAIDEVNEDPAQVNAHIESFRRWVLSMPHIKCPTDAKFLIKFLRVAKYDHAKAQKRLDNFCTIRSSLTKGQPEMFKFFNPNDPVVEKTIRMGILLNVGVTKSGEMLNVGSYEFYDPKEVKTHDFMIIMFMILEMLLQYEETQVTGFTFFADMHKVNKGVLEAWADPKLMKKMTRVWQDCYPIRMKGQIIYREPTWYSIIFNIYTFFLHDKHKKRIMRLKDDITKAFERIPDFENILPKDFGGKGKTKKELIENMLKSLREFYKDGGPWKDIRVDESKRAPETSKYLTEYKDYEGTINLGQAGTFTQFDAL